MKYNGKPAFEMLAVRAKPGGFEIELTEALGDAVINANDFLVQQWWYLPTENYGGPKMGLEKLKIGGMSISKDRTRILLDIPRLKKERVVYIRLPETLKSAGGKSLWSSEAWYTLNNIPE